VNLSPDAQRLEIVADQPHAVPVSIPLTLGDVVSNLASALDYMVCAMAEAKGNAPTRFNAFPIAATLEQYRDMRTSKLHGTPGDAGAIIDAMQPYTSELHSPLAMLDELWQEEKHRNLLMTTAFVQPYWLGHNRRAGTDSGITFRLSSDRASITIEKPRAERFEWAFATVIRLNRPPPLGSWELPGLADMLFSHVAHVVMPQFSRFLSGYQRRAPLVPMRHPARPPRSTWP